MSSRKPVLVPPAEPGAGSTALIPLVHRETVVGVVLVSTPTAMTKQQLRMLEERLASTAVQLVASSLFTQIRETAIAEERSRVSRQIHDGVAQDLTGLAYVLDNIATAGPDSAERGAILQSAAEVRRLVEELRFSIFDLRTGIGADERLGTALATYVHQVGERSGMRVEVAIDDIALDIPANIAHELLRIAQEATANARRHSSARNLWVVYRASPDGVLLRIADDGRGLRPETGRRAGDGVGLTIMHERAERLGGSLTVRPRVGGGTVVECLVVPSAAKRPIGVSTTAQGLEASPAPSIAAVVA